MLLPAVFNCRLALLAQGSMEPCYAPGSPDGDAGDAPGSPCYTSSPPAPPAASLLAFHHGQWVSTPRRSSRFIDSDSDDGPPRGMLVPRGPSESDDSESLSEPSPQPVRPRKKLRKAVVEVTVGGTCTCECGCSAAAELGLCHVCELQCQRAAVDRSVFAEITDQDVETLNIAQMCREDSAARCVWFYTYAKPTDPAASVTPASLGRVGFASLTGDAYAVTQPMNQIEKMATFMEPSNVEVDSSHLHEVVQTTRVSRWTGVVAYMRRKGVSVHVSSGHRMYFSAFRYCMVPSLRKPPASLDPTPLLSPGHPAPAVAAMRPITADAVLARSVAAEEASANRKPRRLTKRVELAQAIVALGLTDAAAVDAYVKAEQRDGRTWLYDFVLGSPDLPMFVEKVWRIENAEKVLARNAMCKTEILRSAGDSLPCVCNGQWKLATEQICARNDIDESALAGMIAENLRDGPGKRLNMFFYGESDCGKSHILDPLNEVYSVFPKPRNNASFALETLPQYEVVLWNELSSSIGVCDWDDFLNWTDGKEFTLDRKGLKNIKVNPTQPLFFTGGSRLYHPQHNERSQTMMDNRMRYTQFFRPFAPAEVRKIPACGRCFARWVLRM